MSVLIVYLFTKTTRQVRRYLLNVLSLSTCDFIYFNKSILFTRSKRDHIKVIGTLEQK